MNGPEARAKKYYSLNGSQVVRRAPLSEVLRGKVCEVVFASTKTQRGRYTIIEAGDLQPSHLGSVENPFHFLPEAQPRNRATSRSGAMFPELAARNLRPQEVAEGATAYTGAPVVNARGEAIQGSGRSWMLRLVYRDFPEKAKLYRQFLAAECGCYGYDPKKLAGFRQPVLVRMLDVGDAEAIVLGQYKAEDLEAVATSTNAVKSRVGKLSEKGVQALLNELESADDPEATLTQTIRASNPLRVLVKEGVIRSDELEKYVRNGQINEEGVKLVSGIVTGLVYRGSDVNTPEYVEMLPAQVKQIVEKSTLALLRVRPAASINSDVCRAIAAAREYAPTRESQSFRNWMQQYDLTGKAPIERYSAFQLRLAETFTASRTQKEAVRQFQDYAAKANGQAGMMFGNVPPMTKAQAVKAVWGVTLVVPFSRVKVAGAPTKPTFRSGVRQLAYKPPRSEAVPPMGSAAVAKTKLKLLALQLKLEN